MSPIVETLFMSVLATGTLGGLRLAVVLTARVPRRPPAATPSTSAAARR
jgi:hypothetical protein